jgi:hypothetical protein
MCENRGQPTSPRASANLFKKYIEHLDPELQQLVLFPFQAAQHWPLLTYQPATRYCAVVCM